MSPPPPAYVDVEGLEQLLVSLEPRLSAKVASVIVEGRVPLQGWIAAVRGDERHGAGDATIEMVPRSLASELTRPWPAIRSQLMQAPPPDRLDVIVETGQAVALMAFDPAPALPVTRAEAEAANLPPHLLFARGEAFASLHPEVMEEGKLALALASHRALVDDAGEELAESFRFATDHAPPGALVGVVLALGPEGRAVSVVTREQSRRLVRGKPLLVHRLERPAVLLATRARAELWRVPVVVWAKGHVSVQTRELVGGR